MDPVVANRRVRAGLRKLRSDEAWKLLLRCRLQSSRERRLRPASFRRLGRLRLCRFLDFLLVSSAIALPYPVIVFADLIDCPSCRGAVGQTLRDGLLVFCAGVFVAIFDEKPIRLARPSIARVHADKRPSPVKLLTFDIEFEVTRGKAFVGVLQGLPRPKVPDHD